MRTRLVPVGAGVLALAGAVLLLSTGPAGEGFGWFAQGSDDTFFVESSSVHLLTTWQALGLLLLWISSLAATALVVGRHLRRTRPS